MKFLKDSEIKLQRQEKKTSLKGLPALKARFHWLCLWVRQEQKTGKGKHHQKDSMYI